MFCWGNGAPGRGRRKRTVGIVKMAHHRPQSMRIKRLENVALSLSMEVLERRKRMPMLASSTRTEAV